MNIKIEDSIICKNKKGDMKVSAGERISGGFVLMHPIESREGKPCVSYGEMYFVDEKTGRHVSDHMKDIDFNAVGEFVGETFKI